MLFEVGFFQASHVNYILCTLSSFDVCLFIWWVSIFKMYSVNSDVGEDPPINSAFITRWSSTTTTTTKIVKFLANNKLLNKWEFTALGISAAWLFIHCFQVKLEIAFRNVGFSRGRNTEEPRKKLSEQGWVPTTNSTHIWRQLWDLNPGHVHWWEASP